MAIASAVSLIQSDGSIPAHDAFSRRGGACRVYRSKDESSIVMPPRERHWLASTCPLPGFGPRLPMSQYFLPVAGLDLRPAQVRIMVTNGVDRRKIKTRY